MGRRSGVARDPAALEQLRAQRSRLADRMRPPWWYLTGVAILYALVFASPFSSRYLPQGDYWAIVVAALAVACWLQWGLDRATGIKVGPRPSACCETAASTIAQAVPQGSR